MVIALVSTDCADAIPEEADEFEFIAERIEALIADGRSIAEGNVKNWRNSEIRRA